MRAALSATAVLLIGIATAVTTAPSVFAWQAGSGSDTYTYRPNGRSLVLKVSALSPTAGISFPLGRKGAIRTTAAFNTNFSEDTEVLLEVGYLRYREYEWGARYFGIQNGFFFGQDVYLIPALLAGLEAPVGERFALFGEAGLGVLIDSDAEEGTLGLFSSGIGIRWGIGGK